MDTGRIPPFDLNAEEAILCCLLTFKDTIYETVDKIKPEHFYVQDNGLIYRAILDLQTANRGIDQITVSDQMRKNQTLEIVGGPVRLAQLSTILNSPRNLQVYVKVVQDAYNNRELIRILTDKVQDCYEGESTAIINQLEGELYRLSSNAVRKDPVSVTEGLAAAVKNIEKFSDHELTGVITPFSRLNTITGGWQKQDLIILGGRPSQGKTQTAIEFILAAASKKEPVLFFSCEMSLQAISTRFICHHAEISNEEIRRGLKEEQWPIVENVIGQLERLPIFIDDTASINITEVRAKARRAKIKYNIGVMVVDYLQLLTCDIAHKGMNRDESVGHIVKELKNIAKDLDIPVIALSQLNRAVELRGDKRPSLSSLRESGDIEAAADLVIFVHNPEYYHDPDAEHCVLELIIAKHRNGRIDTIKISRRDQWYKLTDYDITF